MNSLFIINHTCYLVLWYAFKGCKFQPLWQVTFFVGFRFVGFVWDLGGFAFGLVIHSLFLFFICIAFCLVVKVLRLVIIVLQLVLATVMELLSLYHHLLVFLQSKVRWLRKVLFRLLVYILFILQITFLP